MTVLLGCTDGSEPSTGDMLQPNDATLSHDTGPDARRDAGLDASSRDASSPDASSRDASSPDASSPDASSRDASSPDASSRDASSPDASSPDASSPDAGPDVGLECARDEDCDPESATPVCDLSARQCVRCLPDTHAGCTADELCCEGGVGGGGGPGCRPAQAHGECEGCGVACGLGANDCQDRTCVCGASDSSCDGDTPLCVSGNCVACVGHNDCGADRLCCNGACVGTTLEACSDCDSACAPNGANACVDRSCKCGNFDACTGTSGICVDGADVHCAECSSDLDCSADAGFAAAGRTQCVSGSCHFCDAADSAGCVEASTAPICGADFVCRGCADDAECATTTGNGDRCHAVANGGDGACFACNDGAKNGTETDVDCGGIDCAERCGPGQICSIAARDCVSGVCTGNLCAVATCNDTVRNGNETAVDCGGSCPACTAGLACGAASDCVSGVCTVNLCAAPACDDMVGNGTETAVDCGGNCPACADGLACGDAVDCQSAVCTDSLCQAPSCIDGVRNGSESDTDCGGSCPGCALQAACLADADCAIGDACEGNVCVDCKNGIDELCTNDFLPLCLGTRCVQCSETSQCQAGTICEGNYCFADVEWIAIAGGTYMMGSPDGVGSNNERPQHQVTVRDFHLMRTEVTVAQYDRCVRAGRCTAAATAEHCNWPYQDQLSNHPANCVTWTQARSFASWSGRGARLPTEAEWEFAALSRGQNQTYPWGNDEPTCALAVMSENNNEGCGENNTWPVCSKAAGNSAQGICDLTGNVWEWVEDVFHDTYNGAPADGSAWVLPVGPARASRGRSWTSTAGMLRAAARNGDDPGEWFIDQGFRLAR